MLEKQKIISSNWFTSLSNQICATFNKIEQEYSKENKNTPGTFKQKSWKKKGGGGGGTMNLMRGYVFEKVGVNVSTVSGLISKELRKDILGSSNNRSFWASGISVVAHMQSPKVPAVHMNTRYIITSDKSWFGGGADLTPTITYKNDTEYFHSVLKDTCDLHNPKYYPMYKKWCDEYFFLPHRGESRGVGGIFYDYLNSGSWLKDFSFTKDIGKSFLRAYTPLVRKRMFEPRTKKERMYQLLRRGRYVEFNLLYDRGTQFGLKTGGNIEAILMSLPPEVIWP